MKNKIILGIILLISLVLVESVLGAINVPGDYGTIQDAIDVAIAGDTINVAADTYVENILIENKQNIVIQGVEGTIVEPASGIGFEIRNSDDITIEDFTINTVGLDAHGIYVSTTASTNLNIINNVITINGQSTGIYTSHLSPAHSGWTISGNTISAPNAGVNIELYDVNDVTVSGNTFEVSGSVSFVYSSELSDVSGLILQNNIFNGNGDAAWPGVIPTVWIESDFINWDDNTVVDDVTISGNTFNDWTNSAILIGEDSACCSDVTGVVVNQNKFLKASPESALKSYTSEQVNAENNWWGTYVEIGIEALITGDVDYTPWAEDISRTRFYAPILDVVGGQNVDEGSLLTITLSATDQDAGDSLSYSDNVEFGLLEGNVFTWTPTGTNQGANLIIFTVSDGYIEASETVTITVNNVAPTVDAGEDQTANEGQEISFTATASDPGDDLTYSWDFGDEQTIIEQNPTHIYADNGFYTVTLTVDDGTDEVIDTLTVTVADLTPTAEFTIGAATEDQSVSFTDTSTSVDDLTYSWDFDNDEVEDSTNQNPTHTYTLDGTYTVTLTVTDEDSDTDTITHDVEVSFVDDSPSFIGTIPDVTIDEDGFDDTINLSGYFSDEENALTYNFIITNEEIIQITELENGLINITATPDLYGSSNVIVQAYDTIPYFVNSNSFLVTVNPVNDAPVIDGIEDQTFVEVEADTTLTETITLSDNTTDVDTDNPETFTYAVTSEDETLVNCSVTDNVLSFTLAENWFGTTSCEITADDNTETETSTSESFRLNIEVTNENDAPVIAAIADQTATEEEEFMLQVSATDKDNEVEEGHDTLTYSLTGPEGMLITSTGLVWWKPTNEQALLESVTVIVQVEDGTDSDTEEFVITLTNTNDLPTIPTLVSPIGEIITDSVTLKWTASTDVDEDTIIYYVFHSNDINNITQIAGPISTTEYNINGLNHLETYHWYIIANDGTDDVSSSTSSYSVSLKNAPVIDEFSPLTDLTIMEGDSQLFSITVSDVDVGDTLTYSWTLDGNSVGTNSASYTFAPNFTQAETYTLTATVTDSFDLTDSQTWTVTVTDNTEPEIISYTPLFDPAVKVGDSQLFNIVVEDPDNSLTYTWKVDSAPVGINSNSYTYPATVLGTPDISVEVTDGEFTLSQEWTLTVSNIPIANTFTEGTTDFSLISDLSQATDIVLAKEESKIDFGNETLDLSDVIDLDNNIIVEDNFIGINTDNLPTLNVPATLTMNVNLNQPVIYYNDGFTTNPTEFTQVCDFCTITSYNSNTGELIFTVDHFTTFMVGEEVLKLDIKDLQVKVDSKTDKTITDSGTISKEAKPGSTIKVKVEITNQFQEDMKIEDIYVEATLLGIDDGEDLDEESNEFDLRDGRDKTITFTFEVPKEVDEDTYDLDIYVEGEDENGTTHTVEWTVYLDVEKEKHDIVIENLELRPNKLSCVRNTKLVFDIVNYGQEEEEEVAYSIFSEFIGIDTKQGYFELSEDLFSDDSMLSKSMSIRIGDNFAEGVYPITVKAFYNKDNLEDTETVDLIVEDCEVKVEEVEEEVKVTIGEGEKTTLPSKEKKELEISFKETPEYLALLAGGIVILLVLVILGFAAMVIRLRRR